MKSKLISPTEAWKLLEEFEVGSSEERLPIRKALGRYTAAPIHARDSFPRFDNSAMDGFALRHDEVAAATEQNPVQLRLVGESQAGHYSELGRVRNGECHRISTGAPVPRGATAVVMQENCRITGSTVEVYQQVERGENIRCKGEEISVGACAVLRGVKLNAGTIAWLISLGVERVSVKRLPKVALLRSGNEVVDHGAPRGAEIRDANGPALQLELQRLGIEPYLPAIIPDEPEAVCRALMVALKSYDVVITTGAVSVGTHDHFAPAATSAGVEPLFHGVNQQPGKPVAVGRRGQKLWFGLPGNPVSALTCFYLYVRPFLQRWSGGSSELGWQNFRLAHSTERHHTKHRFLRGALVKGELSLSKRQNSHCLSSFLEAELLAWIEPGERALRRGASVACCPI